MLLKYAEMGITELQSTILRSRTKSRLRNFAGFELILQAQIFYINSAIQHFELKNSIMGLGSQAAGSVTSDQFATVEQ